MTKPINTNSTSSAPTYPEPPAEQLVVTTADIPRDVFVKSSSPGTLTGESCNGRFYPRLTEAECLQRTLQEAQWEAVRQEVGRAVGKDCFFRGITHFFSIFECSTLMEGRSHYFCGLDQRPPCYTASELAERNLADKLITNEPKITRFRRWEIKDNPDQCQPDYRLPKEVGSSPSYCESVHKNGTSEIDYYLCTEEKEPCYMPEKDEYRQCVDRCEESRDEYIIALRLDPHIDCNDRCSNPENGRDEGEGFGGLSR